MSASYLFYAWWKVEFLALIVFSTLVDYTVALQMPQKSQNQKRVLLIMSLITNLGLLFGFKYLSLFVKPPDAMLANIYTAQHPVFGVLVQGVFFAIPVGISFYTFQTLSYTIDVYNNRISPEKHLGKFALFVTFFPQLVAGPIERFADLMPQLKAKYVPNYENFRNGFRLILFGFFVKMCIADNLAPLADEVYSHSLNYTLGSRWIGTLAFCFQIYADFAGYSLIAQGSALLLGISLMDNFKTPYLSTSIGEFWSRWHISLSTWFRDYLYIPLGGNRQSTFKWAVAIMIVFVVSGFWHGANYTFIVWGGIHGLLYLLEKSTTSVIKMKNKTNAKIIGGILIFLGVNAAWVFFRSESIDAAFSHLQSLFQPSGSKMLDIEPQIFVMWLGLILADFALYNKRIDAVLSNYSWPIRWGIYALFLWCISAWAGVTNHPFIYFQF
ncbi:MAG: MBOAT family protein [Flavobacteriales bacterium]|nr:MBOAT family protein [Flavobacteriales bacterium]